MSCGRHQGALIHMKRFDSQAYPMSTSRQQGPICDSKLNIARAGTSSPASNFPFC